MLVLGVGLRTHGLGLLKGLGLGLNFNCFIIARINADEFDPDLFPLCKLSEPLTTYRVHRNNMPAKSYQFLIIVFQCLHGQTDRQTDGQTRPKTCFAQYTAGAQVCLNMQ